MSYGNIKPENLFKELKKEQHIRSALQSKPMYLKLFSNLQSVPQVNKSRNNKPVLWAGIINENLIRNSNNLESYKKALTHKRIQEVINKITNIKNGRIVYNYPKHPKGKSFNLAQLREIIKNFPNLKKALYKKLPTPKPFFVSILPENAVSLTKLEYGEEVYRAPSSKKGVYYYYQPGTVKAIATRRTFKIPETRQEIPINKLEKGTLAINLEKAAAVLKSMDSRKRSFTNYFSMGLGPYYNIRKAAAALKRSRSRSFGKTSASHSR